jgi:hypothetical protein
MKGRQFCLPHGGCLLRGERALETDDAGGLETRSVQPD